MAIGFGVGFIFLYFFSRGDLPGLIAIPLFAICASVGLVLGLVPINGQKADEFLGNYIRAITRPTRRVWKNAKFDARVKEEAANRGIVLEDGNTVKTGGKSKDTNVVGSTGQGTALSQEFIAEDTTQQLDQEEASRLAYIDKLTQEADMLESSIPPVPIEAQAPVTDENPVREQPQETITEETIQQQLPAETTPEMQFQAEELPVEMQGTEPQSTSVETSNKPAPIVISEASAGSYEIEINGLEVLKNSVNIQLVDQDTQPVSGATVLIRDSKGNILQANQSNSLGLIISGKGFPDGTMTVEITHDTLVYPDLKYIFEGKVIPPVRITPA